MDAASLMDKNPTVLKASDTIKTAMQYIMENRYRDLPIVDDEGCYLGSFGVNSLLQLALPKAVMMEKGLVSAPFIHETLADLHHRIKEFEDESVTLWINSKVETVPPTLPLVDTLLILYRTKHSIPVVEPESCQLQGVISYWDAGEKILSA